MDYVKKKVATFFLKKMGFFAELQLRIFLLQHCWTACNIPGSSLKTMRQIRSIGFLVIKILILPCFSDVKKPLDCLIFGRKSWRLFKCLHP
jgi:hypothetical protein